MLFCTTVEHASHAFLTCVPSCQSRVPCLHSTDKGIIHVPACLFPSSIRARYVLFVDMSKLQGVRTREPLDGAARRKICIQRAIIITEFGVTGNKPALEEKESVAAARAPSMARALSGRHNRRPRRPMGCTAARRGEQLLRVVPSEGGGRSNGARSLFFGPICPATMAFGAAQRVCKRGTTCACGGIQLPMFAPLASTSLNEPCYETTARYDCTRCGAKGSWKSRLTLHTCPGNGAGCGEVPSNRDRTWRSSCWCRIASFDEARQNVSAAVHFL